MWDLTEDVLKIWDGDSGYTEKGMRKTKRDWRGGSEGEEGIGRRRDRKAGDRQC